MPTVLLLTCESPSHEEFETAELARSLAAIGIDSHTLPWTDSELRSVPADLALIRSTWDYTQRLDEFLATLDRLAMPVLNPLPVVRWNSSKSYLLDLATAGVPTVPTTLVRRNEPAVLDAVEIRELIIKPTVSAGGRGIGRFSVDDPAAQAHLQTLLESGDVLVQPFLPEIADGERSLIFLAGVYSHAIRKLPASGEFRVQERFGGSNRAHIASGAEIEVANKVLAAVPGGADQLLYARVDLVGSAAHPMVMEVELIEPELFLLHAPGSADRLARDIARLLG